MTEEERRYFYTDGPSPLHEARDRVVLHRKAAAERADELRLEVGAANAVGRGGVEGFVFDRTPDPKHWRLLQLKAPDGKKVWAPKRNTKAGKQLSDRMRTCGFSSPNDILHKTGLDIMRVTARYMLRSSAGWYGDRIFVSIPNDGSGDDFPEIPPYLTECKRWEMEKFIDEYEAASK